MKDRFNKPRVFLSHSKKDVAFIQRLCDDLRKCQIEPWLDDYEIRHGQPWLDEIFENGLPTCDAVLVYITEHSIASPMVKKEIDAGILRKLKDNQIAFLPYVERSALRDQLRFDLQTLQAPEWNDDNYQEVLPRVISEIWRSYLERTITQATQKERVGRLEAELKVQELQKIQDLAALSDSESKDFEYIWKKVDRFESVYFVIKDKAGLETSRHHIKVHMGSLFPMLSDSSRFEYSRHDLPSLLLNVISPSFPTADGKNEHFYMNNVPDIGDEILMYGFVTRFRKENRAGNSISRLMHSPPYGLMYTERLERFKYWLARKGMLPSEIKWQLEETPPASGT